MPPYARVTTPLPLPMLPIPLSRPPLPFAMPPMPLSRPASPGHAPPWPLFMDPLPRTTHPRCPCHDPFPLPCPPCPGHRTPQTPMPPMPCHESSPSMIPPHSPAFPLPCAVTTTLPPADIDTCDRVLSPYPVTHDRSRCTQSSVHVSNEFSEYGEVSLRVMRVAET
nr:pollen-specific leucine-rich repeat extensin-like protein 4 [Penaeus vannamei]